MCSNAQYLLLDEPFDGLDIIVKRSDWFTDEPFKRKFLYGIDPSHNLLELENLIDRVLLKINRSSKTTVWKICEKQRKTTSWSLKQKKVPMVIKENSKMLDFQVVSLLLYLKISQQN